MAPCFGYHGRLLQIDLDTGRSWVETPADNSRRIYAGGGLLAVDYLLRETPPNIDTFDPSNLLILTSSVVAGHPYAGLARFTAATKSPLTDGVGETRCEGPFGLALKRSGVDAILIRGAARVPTSVLIEADTDKVSFHNAARFWGKPVSQAVDSLEAEFGREIHTAVVGPAGENRVRFASIVTDRTYQAARMGIGAVEGSKLLKAVVIRGENTPPVDNRLQKFRCSDRTACPCVRPICHDAGEAHSVFTRRADHGM